jgi:Tfp pilus assembly protein PilO
MWPFDYIPESINPTLRLVIIILISVQFFAFLGYMFVLCKEHKKFKEEEKKKEGGENKANVKTNENNEGKTEKDEDSRRSSSKTRKKLD